VVPKTGELPQTLCGLRGSGGRSARIGLDELTCIKCRKIARRFPQSYNVLRRAHDGDFYAAAIVDGAADPAAALEELAET
jgi:hypothetical protein